MRITFLLPNLNLRGGVRSVVEYADFLTRFGATVTVVFPTRLWRLPLVLNEIEYLWRAPAKMFGRWFKIGARVLAVPSLSARYVPRGDVVMATAWQTAEWAAALPKDRGVPYYFVQDIETHADGDRAAATYKLPFRRIVTSPWIEERLRSQFGATVHALVPYGVDLDLYRPGPPPAVDALTVGALYDRARRKGFDVALAAVEQLRREGLPIRMRVFGSPRHPPSLPDFIEPSWRLAPRETPEFYRSCAIWLGASRSDGFYMPGMEALACGCALVTTRVGGSVYYAVPEKTALVCDPGDGAGLTTALRRAVQDPALRADLVKNGLNYVRRHPQVEAARNMFRALSGEAVRIEPEPGLVATHAD